MIIYKVLTGNYPFIHQEEFFHPRIKYYYFHTHDILNKSGKWKFIKIPIEKNLIYTQRKYKILSHKYFNEPTLYLDHGNMLKPNSYEKIKSLLGSNNFNVVRNEERKTYLDECIDWSFVCSNEKEIIKITRYLKFIKYNFSFHFGTFCGSLLRHKSENINNMWWYFWKKFNKRDQLFLPPAVFFTKQKIKLINFDDFFYKKPKIVDLFFPRKNVSSQVYNLQKKINSIVGLKENINLQGMLKRLHV